MNALSEEECLKLRDKRVTVVGCGGLGGYVISALARVGVGNLTIVDSDSFEETNLNRQIFSREHNLGKSKAQIVADAVSEINSEIKVNALQVKLEEANASEIISGADVVVDCLDNFEARFWLGHTANKLGIPCIYGAIAG